MWVDLFLPLVLMLRLETYQALRPAKHAHAKPWAWHPCKLAPKFEPNQNPSVPCPRLCVGILRGAHVGRSISAARLNAAAGNVPSFAPREACPRKAVGMAPLQISAEI